MLTSRHLVLVGQNVLNVDYYFIYTTSFLLHDFAYKSNYSSVYLFIYSFCIAEISTVDDVEIIKL